MTVRLLAPQRYRDTRGWFSETWNKKRFEDWGVNAEFCQDNHSLSKSPGTLRGLHFQSRPHAQAKLVRCVRGRILDVAVDIRRDSPTYRNWVAIELTAATGGQLYIPAGYAHAFLTLEENCEVAYKVDAYYAPEAEGGIAWNDKEIAIDWPKDFGDPLLSEKDAILPPLSNMDIVFPYDGNPLLPIEA